MPRCNLYRPTVIVFDPSVGVRGQNVTELKPIADPEEAELLRALKQPPNPQASGEENGEARLGGSFILGVALEAGAYTRQLFSSTEAVSDTQNTP
jgi:hypothetical protein